MTKIIIAILLLGCCSSCSNTSDKQNDTPPVAAASKPVEMPEQERALRDQLAEHPDSMLLKEKLIEYFRSNGSYEQAALETEILLQKDSLNDRLWDILGTVQFENYDTVKAIQAYETAVHIRPLPEYVMSLGSLYAETGNPAALEVADGLLTATKAHAEREGFFLKGLYYNTKHEYDKAIGFLNQCLSIDPTYLNAYREKAMCLYELGKYKEAINLLDKSLSIRPTFDEGYYWMGRCYEKTGDRKNAVTCYQNALQIDKEYVEAKDALYRLGEQP